jgi:Fe2+ or Zn2+ uptake regulation protein
MTRRQTMHVRELLWECLDVPATSTELWERYRLLDADEWISAAVVYNNLRRWEQQGVVSALRLPGHSRSVLWWKTP